VNDKATLDIVQNPEVFTALLDGDNVLEATRVPGVGSDFAIDFDGSLINDGCDFSIAKSILKTTAKENTERERLSQFMGTRRRASSLVERIEYVIKKVTR
jgi:hypothetical protein